MKKISFELTMPNRGSWNNRWSGQERKFWVLKSLTDKAYKSLIEFLKGEDSWFYEFGDGWTARIKLETIDAKESARRKKLTAGFSGYEWMINSIMIHGEIKKPS